MPYNQRARREVPAQLLELRWLIVAFAKKTVNIALNFDLG
jgi:hypothetical protein